MQVEQGKIQLEQAKIQTQGQIEQLKAQQAKELEQMRQEYESAREQVRQEAETQRLQMKAQIEAETKLQVAKIQKGAKEETDEPEINLLENIRDMMSQMAETLGNTISVTRDEIIQMSNTPKKTRLIRDNNGKVQEVEINGIVRPVIRDQFGNIESI